MLLTENCTSAFTHISPESLTSHFEEQGAAAAAAAARRKRGKEKRASLICLTAMSACLSDGSCLLYDQATVPWTKTG